MKIWHILILAFASVLKLLYAKNTGLVPDEAYYWEWSRQLDFSYYDQGPGVAVFIRLFTSILGNNNFALKFAAIFASFLTSLNVYLIAVSLGWNRLQLKWVLVFLVLIPCFLAGSTLIMHDSALLLSWSFALLAAVRFVLFRNPVYIYLLFAFMGFGALSKHTMVFFAIGVILWLIFTPSEYKLLKSIHFWFGMILAVLIISPVIYWNINNDWENIDAIINLRSSGGANFNKITTGAFLVGQLVSISPIWFFGALLVLIYSFQPIFKGEPKSESLFSRIKHWAIESENPVSVAQKLLFFQAATLPIFFFLLSFRKDIQANWVYASYLALIPFLGKFMDSTKLTYRYTMILGIVPAILFDVLSLYSIPISKLVPAKIEPHYVFGYRQEGFKEIVNRVDNLRTQKDPNAGIVTNRYQDAAIFSWYLPGQPNIISLNIMQKNQYNRWKGLEKGKNYFLVYIQEKTCQKSFVFFQPFLHFMFEEVEEFPEEDILENGLVIKRFQVWHLKNYRKSWALPMSEYISKKMILTLMPNLTGLSPYEMKDPVGNMGIELLTGYLNREGEVECSFIRK